jgi:adenylate cyclase
MKIHLSITYQGKTSEFRAKSSSIVIGRSHGGGPVDLDLTDDTRVSRRHARITWQNNKFWLEDLGSRHGTRLNGKEIKGAGPCLFEPLGEAIIGDTKLRLESGSAESPVQERAETQETGIARSVGTHEQSAEFVQSERASLERTIAVLSGLPMRLATETKLHDLCQATVEAVVELIPGVQRCALLLKDRDDGLSLQAFLPKNEPHASVSDRELNRAISEKQGFIGDSQDEHIAQYHSLGSALGTCIYSPLVWNNETIGVICVDNPARRSPFTTLDLHLAEAVSQYASMAIAQHNAQEALTKQTDFTNRLFSSRFPPLVRDGLMRQAAEDSLPIGTRQWLVTVLNSDIRQFTKLSEELGPQAIGDLLNEYFPPLIEAIFAHKGTVERFAGDGIFAVFGAPERDSKQREHAVLAALEMQRKVRELNESRAKQSKTGIGIGIGIDCGQVLNGFIGNAERLEFTVIGDAANKASRYCSGAAPGEILIGHMVRSRVFKLVDSVERKITDKHGDNLTAYAIVGLTNPQKLRAGRIDDLIAG